MPEAMWKMIALEGGPTASLTSLSHSDVGPRLNMGDGNWVSLSPGNAHSRVSLTSSLWAVNLPFTSYYGYSLTFIPSYLMNHFPYWTVSTTILYPHILALCLNTVGAQ